MTIAELQKIIHADNVERGWWDGVEGDLPLDGIKDRSHNWIIIEKLCLIHSEISEALEEVRDGKPPNLVYPMPDGSSDPNRVPKPCGFPTELADAVIRILDLAEACGIDDLGTVIEQKLAYNRTRGWRHGGKKA